MLRHASKHIEDKKRWRAINRMIDLSYRLYIETEGHNHGYKRDAFEKAYRGFLEGHNGVTYSPGCLYVIAKRFKKYDQ